MTSIDDQTISAQVDLAERLAADGSLASAAHAFATARELAVTKCGEPLLTQRLRAHAAALARERITYRDAIARRRTASQTLLVLADSLGLPRPEAKTGASAGADDTYPVLVLDRLVEHQVESHCQRYFTSRSVLKLLGEDKALGHGADVVIHVGLNDCATRMFQEPHRLALDSVADDVKDRIVAFAQRHRRMLLAELPALHYVDPETFSSNMEASVRLLQERGARRIVLTTIILPPERFWPATPGINANFGDYNQRIMRVAAQTSAALFDLDRLIAARQHQDVLLPDGMHLSPNGHALFAEKVAELIA